MKCEDCQVLMEEYADGALDQKPAGLVSSHMASCANCASYYAELKSEQEIYARYQRDVEVTPVLWSSIESRIKQARAARPAGLFTRLGERFAVLFAARLSPGFAAALVIVAIGITVGVMTFLNSRGPSQVISQGKSSDRVGTPSSGDGSGTPTPPAASTPPQPEVAKIEPNPPIRPNKAPTGPKLVATTKQTPEQLVREAEQKYLSAIAMLSRDVSRHRSQLDPIMLARFDAALGDIDRTIKDTRRLVRDNPGDPIALQYLLAAYSKKVDVLREMTLTVN